MMNGETIVAGGMVSGETLLGATRDSNLRKDIIVRGLKVNGT